MFFSWVGTAGNHGIRLLVRPPTSSGTAKDALLFVRGQDGEMCRLASAAEGHEMRIFPVCFGRCRGAFH